MPFFFVHYSLNQFLIEKNSEKILMTFSHSFIFLKINKPVHLRKNLQINLINLESEFSFLKQLIDFNLNSSRIYLKEDKSKL